MMDGVYFVGLEFGRTDDVAREIVPDDLVRIEFRRVQGRNDRISWPPRLSTPMFIAFARREGCPSTLNVRRWGGGWPPVRRFRKPTKTPASTLPSAAIKRSTPRGFIAEVMLSEKRRSVTRPVGVSSFAAQILPLR